MPDGAVCVTRPGRFGNPFVGDRAVEAYREWLLRVSSSARTVARLFDCKVVQVWIWQTAESVVDDLGQLRGKDLACFCAPGKPCHADVLLEMANQEK